METTNISSAAVADSGALRDLVIEAYRTPDLAYRDPKGRAVRCYRELTGQGLLAAVDFVNEALESASL